MQFSRLAVFSLFVIVAIPTIWYVFTVPMVCKCEIHKIYGEMRDKLIAGNSISDASKIILTYGSTYGEGFQICYKNKPTSGKVDAGFGVAPEKCRYVRTYFSTSTGLIKSADEAIVSYELDSYIPDINLDVDQDLNQRKTMEEQGKITKQRLIAYMNRTNDICKIYSEQGRDGINLSGTLDCHGGRAIHFNLFSFSSDLISATFYPRGFYYMQRQLSNP